MLTQRRFLLAAISAIALLGSSTAARATTVETIATPFIGADTSVHIFLDDAGGNIAVTLTVNEGSADLRGFFLNISDFSLFAGLSVTGDDVTSFVLEDDGVINLHHGVNLNGGGSPCPCDLGVVLGTPGIGKDDIFSTTFVLDADAPLTIVDAFANQLAGVRVTSVGTSGSGFDSKDPKDDFKDGLRHGSAKLVATIPDPTLPVPEPSTALLIALGVGALGYQARSRR